MKVVAENVVDTYKMQYKMMYFCYISEPFIVQIVTKKYDNTI